MTYSNASPLMVHGKNQQVLRWFVSKPLAVVEVAVVVKHMVVKLVLVVVVRP
jgi:hypothetical protein